MIVCVPSGIGDVSWMYSKLMHAPPMEWEIADGWPHRTAPFLSLLPNVISARYGEFNYSDIIAMQSARPPLARWADVNGCARLMLEANQHLEMGKPLVEWLPDLPVEFHYDIGTTDRDKERAESLLEGFRRPWWGVSAASYRGSEAWKTWGLEEWSEFLGKFHAEAEGTIILLGGFWDDLTSQLSELGYPDLVGRTSIGCAVEVLRSLDGYLGFSSGLGVLRTVLRKKVFMLWPEHQQLLSTSWAPPWMVEEGSYVAKQWDDPGRILPAALKWAHE